MRNPELGSRSNDRDNRNDFERIARSERVERIARPRFQANLERSEPDGLLQKIIKKVSDPNVMGGIAAVGFAVMMTADVVLNGPSEFVVNSPEAATTTLALGAAAIGTLFSRLARLAEMKDLKAKRQAEREARKKEQQW